jgi:hypothetical protein
MRTLERLAFGLFALIMIMLLMAIATALQGFSMLHQGHVKMDPDTVCTNQTTGRVK